MLFFTREKCEFFKSRDVIGVIFNIECGDQFNSTFYILKKRDIHISLPLIVPAVQASLMLYDAIKSIIMQSCRRFCTLGGHDSD